MTGDDFGTPLLGRRIARDLLPCAMVPQVLDALGYVPAGPEVDEVEHLESHRRLATTLPLARPLRRLSDLCATVVCTASAVEQSDYPPLHTAAWYAEQARYASVVHGTATVTIANILSVGLLQLGASA